MSQDIKSLRNRIKSVDSTLHLTKAMGLVASSKIKKANDAMYNARSYIEALEGTMSMLTSSAECQKSPYMRKNINEAENFDNDITSSEYEAKSNEISEANINDGEGVRIIAIAGDKGMAGGYNANIFRELKNYPKAEIIPIGKKVCERYNADIISSEHFLPSTAVEIAKKQCEDFIAGKYRTLCVLGTKYVSAITQEPQITKLLPLDNNSATSTGIIFEPDELTILNTVVPDYVAGMITSLIRESFACEVTARRAAMDSAGKNAQEMIDELKLEYNHARQGAITQEITEIVAGSGI